MQASICLDLFSDQLRPDQPVRVSNPVIVPCLPCSKWMFNLVPNRQIIVASVLWCFASLRCHLLLLLFANFIS